MSLCWIIVGLVLVLTTLSATHRNHPKQLSGLYFETRGGSTLLNDKLREALVRRGVCCVQSRDCNADVAILASNVVVTQKNNDQSVDVEFNITYGKSIMGKGSDLSRHARKVDWQSIANRIVDRISTKSGKITVLPDSTHICPFKL